MTDGTVAIFLFTKNEKERNFENLKEISKRETFSFGWMSALC